MVILLTLTAAGSGGGLDPAIVAAIIGGIAAVIGAIGAFAGVMYGSRQQKKMMRFQKELEAQEARKKEEEQRKADRLDAARREMVLAQNNAERAKAYRRALHADPRISRLQILDMSRPLEVTSVYVRVRVHEEARLRYEVDPQLLPAEHERDPNAILQASRAYMEKRASAAIDPDEALRKYRRCAILGDPGAGKTTLLKYLTLKAADKQLADLPDLPIHQMLRQFPPPAFRLWGELPFSFRPGRSKPSGLFVAVCNWRCRGPSCHPIGADQSTRNCVCQRQNTPDLDISHSQTGEIHAPPWVQCSSAACRPF